MKQKIYQLYTEKVVNGVVVGEYKGFTEKQLKKMIQSCEKSSKSHQKVVKFKKK